MRRNATLASIQGSLELKPNGEDTGDLYVAGSIFYLRDNAETELTAPCKKAIYTQAVPAATWTVPHNLDTDIPYIAIYDSNERPLLAATEKVDKNTTVIRLATPVAGKAVFARI